MLKALSILVLAGLAGGACAQTVIKPGLWEMRMGKNVVDGKDTSAEMAGMAAQMKEEMAKLSPEERAQIGAMMGQRGMGLPGDGSGAAIQLCITPEMARRDVPVTDKDGACQPMNTRRSGNRMSYEISCVGRDGARTTGKGESTIQGDTVSTRSDMTVVERGQTHRIQSESEMRFVKSDCGKVKPITAPRRP